MKVFIGSSKESLEKAEDIAAFISEKGHTPIIWNKAFKAGEYTFERLDDIAQSVDAAIFIFSQDDAIWYSENDVIMSVRDNVLIEYGLFCGALGRRNVAIAFNGKPKIASDLYGITYIDINKMAQAIPKIREWLNGCREKRRTSINELLLQVSKLYDKNHPESKEADEVMKILDEVLALYPKCIEAQRSQAGVYYDRRQFRKAAHLWEEMVDSCNNAWNYFLVGIAYRLAGEYERAIHYLKIAVYLNDKYSHAHKNLGHAYEAIGNNEKAQEHFRLAGVDLDFAPIDLTKTFKNRTVSIQSLANNKYLGADKDQDNTPIFAHLDIRGNWELFEVEITQDGWAAFRACNNGKYISARDDESGTPLFACADTVRDRECFKIFLHNGNHLLKARVNNKYIMADINRSITPGVVGLYAYVYEAQEWEQFQIKIVG